MNKFKDSLTASFSQLRADRAEGIAEDVELEYKRDIEDRMRRIRQYDRKRENLILDLCPQSITSTQVVPSDFDAREFMKTDVKIGIDRRNECVILEIVVDRYEQLFGAYPDSAKINEILPNWTSKIK